MPSTKIRNFSFASRCAAALAAAIFCLAPASAAARTVKVRAATQNELRNKTFQWDEKLKKLFEDASAAFETRFGIQFQVVESEIWKPDEAANTMETLYNDLLNNMGHGQAELTVGFSRLPEKGSKNVSGLVWKHDYALVNVPEWDEKRALHILIHELAHVFGATHSSDPKSVMFGEYQKPLEELQFDPVNESLIRLMKDADLENFSQSLDEATLLKYRELLDQAAKQTPDDFIVQMERGILHYHLGNDTLPEAAASFRRAAQIDQQSARAANYLGRVLLRQDKPQEALTAFAQAATVAPNSLWAFYGMGESLSRLGRLAEALESYERAAGLNPNSPETALGMAEVLRRLGRYSEAIGSYQSAEAAMAEDEQFILGYGRSLKNAGLWPEAIHWLGKIVLKKTGDINALLELAEAALNAGDFELAGQCLTGVLQIEPLHFEGSLLYARMLQMQGEEQEARTLIDDALARPAEDPLKRLLAGGEALRRIGDNDGSLEMFKDAVYLAPESAEARIGLGQAYDARGWTTRALQEYQNAALLSPYDPKTYRYLLQSCLENGQPGLGRQVVQKAKSMKIGLPEALAARFE